MERSPTTRLKRVPLLAACALLSLASSDVESEVTCLLAANKSVKGKAVPQLSVMKGDSQGKKGEVSALSGPAGEDGQLRVYGAGSAGAFTLNEGAGFHSRTTPPIETRSLPQLLSVRRPVLPCRGERYLGPREIYLSLV